VPLTPAPQKKAIPSAVYRCHPGYCDGSLLTADLTVRVFHYSPEEAEKELSRLRKALLRDGDSGVIGTGADTLILCETDKGGAAGAIPGTPLYYVQAGFTAQGRV
jgi:hypothetical protein